MPLTHLNAATTGRQNAPHTSQQRVIVALHDGFYGATSGTGFSNRAFLTALARLLPAGRLVVLPAAPSSPHPRPDPQWSGNLLRTLDRAGAAILPLPEALPRGDGVRGREELCGLVTRETMRVAARSGRCLLIGLDVPFLGLGAYAPDNVDVLLVPRTTAMLTRPDDRQLVRWERTSLRTAARRRVRVAAISPFMRWHLKGAYGVPEQTLIDLPNGLVSGLDDEAGQPVPPLPAPARAGFLLAMGRAVPEKGFEDLLNALVSLRDRGVRLPHLVLAATNTAPRPDHHQVLLADIIREHRLDATLIARFAPAVRGWLRSPALRAVIVPSREEPFGRIPLEAFAAQAGPVVATGAGGLAQTVREGVTGFSAEPNNPRSLAAAIRRALTVTPREREQLASAGTTLLTTRYDYQATIRAALGEHVPWVLSPEPDARGDSR